MIQKSVIKKKIEMWRKFGNLVKLSGENGKLGEKMDIWKKFLNLENF